MTDLDFIDNELAETDNCEVVNTYEQFFKEGSSDNKNRLNILHLNIRSIKKHFDEFLFCASDVIGLLDVIIFSELNITEMEFSNSGSLFTINGYGRLHFTRKNRRGGGILIFYKDTYRISLMNLAFSACESISFKLHLERESDILMLVVYRPPNTSSITFLEELEEHLSQFDRQNIILVGDTNLDLSKPDAVTAEYLNLMNGRGFTCKINTTTREEMRDGNLVSACIDHFFERLKDSTTRAAVVSTKISDHYSICLSITFDKIVNVPVKAPVYVTKTDQRILSRVLRESFDNNNVEDIMDATQLYEFIVHTYENARNASTTTCTIRNKRKNQKPWINKQIKDEIKVRDRLFRAWKNAESPYMEAKLRDQYKKKRNYINKLIGEVKKRHYTSLFDNCRGDMRTTWKHINEVLGRSSKESNDDKIVAHFNSDGLTVANNFADFFAGSAFSDVHTCNGRLWQKQRMGNGLDLGSVQLQSIFLPDITDDDVLKIITKSKKNSAGLDNLRLIDISRNLDAFVSVLTKFCNLSLHEGCCPAALKVAMVRPVFKKGKRNDYSNYRPISILPSIDKIIERYLSDRITNYLKKFNLLDPQQFGFIATRSTVTALGRFSDLVNAKLNEGMHVICIFIDFSKAFDSIDHGKLLEMMFNLGIRGHLLAWLKDYLNDRQMVVKLVGDYSRKMKLGRGVPQGSILGPLLYLMYVGDIGNCFLKSSYFLYADDTVIVSAHKDVQKAVLNISEEFRSFQMWAHDKELKINIAKTNVMHIRSPHRNSMSAIAVTFHAGQCLHSVFAGSCDCPDVLPQVETQRYLGVTIDDRFLWGDHIEDLNNRLRAVSRKFYWLSRIILDRKILLTIYYSLFDSLLGYGISVWGAASNYLLDSIQNIQNRVIKLLFPDRQNIEEMYEEAGILTVKKLYIFKTLSEHHGMLNTYQRVHHQYDTRTRGRQDLQSMTYTNKYGQRTSAYRIPKMMNQLPVNIREQENINSFKIYLKRHLIEN